MENKLPFIYRTFFISIVSALSIFIIPIPITIFLLIKHYKLIKEQQILIEPILETYNSIELAKERLEKINADLDNQEELHTNNLKSKSRSPRYSLFVRRIYSKSHDEKRRIRKTK